MGEGGKLGEVSDKISLFYEEKLGASIKSVMALIEPLMIVCRTPSGEAIIKGFFI